MKKYAFNVAVVFCCIVQNGQILLIRREKPPAYHEYTIVGGKKERGENLFAACKREVLEETGLHAHTLKLRGVVNNILEGMDFEVTAYYFLCENFSGQLRSSAEGALEWCDLKSSFHKKGISDYYLRIVPFVFQSEDVFLGSLFVERTGNIRRFDIQTPSL